MRTRTVVGFAVLSAAFLLSCSGGEGPTTPTPPPPTVMCSYPGLGHLKASDPGCVPPPPAPTITLNPPSTSAMVGDSMTVRAVTTDATSCTFGTSGGAERVATYGCDSVRVTFKSLGTAAITASATGPGGTATAPQKEITVNPRPTLTFTGKIVLLNVQPGDSPKGWIVSVEVAGENKVSSTSNDDGTYLLSGISVGPTRTAIITLVPPPGSRYFPQYLETTTAYSSVNMKWPVLPAQWIRETGIYAGEHVPVNFLEIMTGDDVGRFVPVTRMFQTGMTQQGFGYYNYATWARTGDLPVRVAFDRTRSTSPLTSEDSVSFWRRAEEINRVMGREYIVPSTRDEVLLKRRGILVYVNSALAVGASGDPPLALSDPVEVVTNNIAVISHLQIKDHIWFSNPDIDTYFPRLVRHELMHTLGFGHTLLWDSLMRPEAEGATTLTSRDAAYLEIATAMGYTQKEHFTLLGFAENFNGDRVVNRGLPPSTNTPLP